MNEQRIEEIKNRIRQVMQLISEVGEEPPPEVQELILQVLQRSQQQIQALRQEDQARREQPPTPPTGGAPSPDAQLLWILAGQQEQAFISYLRDFPSPATRALLANPLELSRTIEYLSRIMPQGVQPVMDGIRHADLNSSNVWGVSYDPSSSRMRVRFQGGSVYEYDGIPQNIYRAFIHGNAAARTDGQNEHGRWWVGKNPSLGAAMNQYIKAGGFPYRRIH